MQYCTVLHPGDHSLILIHIQLSCQAAVVRWHRLFCSYILPPSDNKSGMDKSNPHSDVWTILLTIWALTSKQCRHFLLPLKTRIVEYSWQEIYHSQPNIWTNQPIKPTNRTNQSINLPPPGWLWTDGWTGLPSSEVKSKRKYIVFTVLLKTLPRFIEDTFKII